MLSKIYVLFLIYIYYSTKYIYLALYKYKSL